jgi:pimeloyl-ACP methyl ester carboxylesterase
VGNDGIARYRSAERALWSHYDLEPIEHFVDVRAPQVRFRVNEVGAGGPILFIHGMLGTGPYWGPLLQQLSGFRSLLLDRLGYGLSSALDWSAHDMGATTADLLIAALDKLEVPRVHVVGGSIGGVLGLHLARRHPERVGRIVMLGGGPLVPEFPVPFVFRVMASPLGFVVERLGRKEKVMRSIIGSSGHGASLADGRIPDAFVDWRVALQRHTPSMRNERAGLRAIIGADGWRPSIAMADSELAAIHHPTLLLQGSADPTAPLALWERVMRVLPQGELQVVEGAGHQPWLDDPEAIGAGVSRFLRG